MVSGRKAAVYIVLAPVPEQAPSTKRSDMERALEAAAASARNVRLKAVFAEKRSDSERAMEATSKRCARSAALQIVLNNRKQASEIV